MKMSKSLLTAAMITAAGFGLAAANVQISAAEELPESTQTSEYEIDLPQEAVENQTGLASDDASSMESEEATGITETEDNEKPVSSAAEETKQPDAESSMLAETRINQQEKNTVTETFKPAADRTETADQKNSAEENALRTTVRANPSANALKQTGWVKDSYLQNGVAVTNKFLTIDNETYYFNAQGKKATGQRLIDGSYYCFDLKTGSMKKGITDLSEEYNGKRNGGAKTVYYDTVTGKMRYGQQLIDDAYYCFDLSSGAMKKGIAYLSEAYNSPKNGGAKTVYYDLKNGRMRYGQQFVQGSYYCFDLNSGAMKKGITYLSEAYNSVKNGGAKTVYYDKNSGKMRYGQQYIDGGYYCFDLSSGAMKKGITYLSEAYNPPKNGGAKTVYYDKNNGKMRYGQQCIDGDYYCFDLSSGAMKKGITYLSEAYNSAKNGGAKTVYYDRESGKMQYGLQKIDGRQYCFDLKDGSRKTGITSLTKEYDAKNPRIVYFDANGVMKTGVIKVGDKTHVFEHNTGAMKSGFLKLNESYGYKNGSVVYCDAKGEMKFGEQKIDKYWYCFDLKDGVMKTGFVKLTKEYTKNPKTVYYDKNGRMLYGDQTINGKKYYFDPVTGAQTTKPTVNPGTTTTRPVAKNVSYRTDASGKVVEATNKNVTVMSQTDSRWAYDTINGYTVASTGCCATVMTMVINALNGTNYSIAQIGQEAANVGYMNSSYLGMGGNGINYLASRYGLTVKKNLSASEVKGIINRGGLVTCGLGYGPFVQSSNPSDSHEILIYGYNGNNSKVIDPYGGYMSGEWSTSYIFSMPSQDRDDRANGGPFFGIYKA